MIDYEKEYKEALERARQVHTTNVDENKKSSEYIFPELRESEDEKIIRTLKEIVNWGCSKNISVENNVELKDCLAWLEKQGERKPADKVIEEEKPLLEKFKQAVYDCAWGKVTCKTEGETQEEYAERWAEQFLLMVRDWADDYIDFTIQQKLRNSYEKGKANIIETLHEQKPAWSEEDEYNVAFIVELLLGQDSLDKEYLNQCKKAASWLKSLKNKVQPQLKQEWSEEDEYQINTILHGLDLKREKYRKEENQVEENRYKTQYDWLKSLKERMKGE